MAKKKRHGRKVHRRFPCRYCHVMMIKPSLTGLCASCYRKKAFQYEVPADASREECRDRVEEYRRQLETTGRIDYSDPPPLVHSEELRTKRAGHLGEGIGRQSQYNSEDHRQRKRRYRLALPMS